MILHQAIAKVLGDSDTILELDKIVSLINKGGLYTKRKGAQADTWLVGVRATEHRELFKVFVQLK